MTHYQRRLVLLVVCVMVLFFGACSLSPDDSTPTPTGFSPPTPTVLEAQLPDLVISTVTLESRTDDLCVDPTAPLGLVVRVKNQGAGDAGSFIVTTNSIRQEVGEGLAAGGIISLWFSGYTDLNEIKVDSLEQVQESDETNNSLVRELTSPSLSEYCLPAPVEEVQIDEPLHTMVAHQGKVLVVAFSPDGSLVASGGIDNTMRLWRVNEGNLLRTMQGHPFPISALSFSPDGIHLTSGSYDSLIRIWRVTDTRLMFTLKGHAGRIVDLAYTKDGRTFATAAEDFTVRIWRAANGQLTETIDESYADITGVAFSANGRWIGWAEGDGSVRVRLIHDRTWVYQIKENQAATALAFSPDGQVFAAGFEDGKIRVWQTSDGALILTLAGHTQAITRLAFSPDSRLLASASKDTRLGLWRTEGVVENRTPLLWLEGHTEPVTSVAFSPRGTRLASAGEDGSVRIWEVQSGLLP